MNYVLGIDVGTTSVKMVVLDENQKIIGSCSKDTNAYIQHSTFAEQDCNKIISCISECLKKLSKEVISSALGHVSVIAICGQMHGCVFWRSRHIKQYIDLMENFDDNDLSNLITWQDARCDGDFLKSLPSTKPHSVPLSSGFGCATIMWLKKYNPHFLQKYDCCGTIADYLVARLCSLAKPLISNQNAASWGYFNPQDQNWDLPTLTKIGFPVHLIPEVLLPGSPAGKLCSTYLGLTVDTKVTVALGDMQCSVLSCHLKPNEAVFNISTSAQLSMSVKREADIKKPTVVGENFPPSLCRVPFFGRQDLLTSASLNGGAVFGHFVQMLTEWTRNFVPDVTEERVYSQLISSAEAVDASDHLPLCNPTLYGERHDPSSRCSFSDIGVSDVRLPVISRSIVRGILQNVRSMFEANSVFSVKDIEHLRACGGAFRKNALFREMLTQVFNDVKVTFMADADAALGAALSTFDF